jgi:hypothetical protein
VRIRIAAVMAAATTLATSAHAQVLAPEAFHGLVDLRLAAAEGEASWLDGGAGKTQASGDGGWKVEPSLAEASLEWKPRFGFALSGVITAHLQPATEPVLDLGEAFVRYRTGPSEAGRITARAGVFYPPVSLEHEGVAWTTPDMLSASAINSWIGEEVKVAGAELTYTRTLGAHELSATGAVFGWNDTSGTLLTFRGWALHGVKTGVATSFPLPRLSPYMVPRQAPITDPYYELDRRAGYYGRLEWRPPAPVALDVLYYDNVGDRVAVEAKQWAWETRFVNLGLRWDVDDQTRVRAQAMNGETLMGFRTPGGLWVDMGFASAYLLGQRDIGEHTLSARLDWFDTRDRTLRAVDDNDEGGWAVTGAFRQRLAPFADLIYEAMHVTSDRPGRRYAGERPHEAQTVLQAALRLSF